MFGWAQFLLDKNNQSLRCELHVLLSLCFVGMVGSMCNVWSSDNRRTEEVSKYGVLQLLQDLLGCFCPATVGGTYRLASFLFSFTLLSPCSASTTFLSLLHSSHFCLCLSWSFVLEVFSVSSVSMLQSVQGLFESRLSYSRFQPYCPRVIPGQHGWTHTAIYSQNLKKQVGTECFLSSKLYLI